MEHGLIVAGFGGQGVVLAGKLIATAALMDGREVVWSPSYGPEMRGGEVHCTVVVADRQIGSPVISVPDALIVMDQASASRFAPLLREGGFLLLNRSLIQNEPPGEGREVLAIAATEEATRLGDPRVANVLLVGAYLTRRPTVSVESLIEAMRQGARGSQKLLDINLEALRRGQELARSEGGPS